MAAIPNNSLTDTTTTFAPATTHTQPETPTHKKTNTFPKLWARNHFFKISPALGFLFTINVIMRPAVDMRPKQTRKKQRPRVVRTTAMRTSRSRRPTPIHDQGYPHQSTPIHWQTPPQLSRPPLPTFNPKPPPTRKPTSLQNCGHGIIFSRSDQPRGSFSPSLS